MTLTTLTWIRKEQEETVLYNLNNDPYSNYLGTWKVGNTNGNQVQLLLDGMSIDRAKRTLLMEQVASYNALPIVHKTPSKTGLGDAVAKALSFVGITEERVSHWVGEDCGCAERREKLNQLGAWASKAISHGVSEALNRLTAIVGEPMQPQRVTPSLNWSYGITTVPSRIKTLFPQTLTTLMNVGFDKPRIFVDQCSLREGTELYEQFGLPLTVREGIRTAGHWVLTAYELYIRNPYAERYAIFQDDFTCVRNLKRYLEIVKYPEKGYQNLYTFPSNESIAPKNCKGWYESNQTGRGAVALVFSNEAMRVLMGQDYLVNRFQCTKRGHKAIDGGIVDALKRVGWKEYVHSPSLIQHLGLESSMGNGPHPASKTFPGEDFDALQLLV